MTTEASTPPAKRKKLESEHERAKIGGPWNANATGLVRSSSQSNQMKSEFPLRNLEDFYKACPTYRLPVEIGSFSLDEKGKQHLDRSQLKYYSAPPPSQSSRLNFDLKVGFDKFVPSNRSVPSDKLNPILRWIAVNGDSFRPKVFSPKSPEKDSEEGGVRGGVNGSDERRRVSIGESINTPLACADRPDNLLTNFVTWRGLLTKLLCSPYSKTEPWRLAATLYNGTIYLSEIETEEAKRNRETQTPRMKEMCYWGVKFEDYVTSTEPPSAVRMDAVSSPHTGTVNANRAFCTVVRTRMNTHSIVMAAEVDCCDHMSKEKPPQNYVELKTSRVILTDRNKSSFKRYKLMKWWAQSFLVGVPKVICGFRNDEGIVQSLQHFKTSLMVHESQTDLSMWQPAVCLNFLDELLTWIRRVVAVDNAKEVYLLEWAAPFDHVSCTKCPPDSEFLFLPDWFIEKLPPPNPKSTEESVPHKS